MSKETKRSTTKKTTSMAHETAKQNMTEKAVRTNPNPDIAERKTVRPGGTGNGVHISEATDQQIAAELQRCQAEYGKMALLQEKLNEQRRVCLGKMTELENEQRRRAAAQNKG
jgi:hypothetical protein